MEKCKQVAKNMTRYQNGGVGSWAGNRQMRLKELKPISMAILKADIEGERLQQNSEILRIDSSRDTWY